MFSFVLFVRFERFQGSCFDFFVFWFSRASVWLFGDVHLICLVCLVPSLCCLLCDLYMCYLYVLSFMLCVCVFAYCRIYVFDLYGS